MDLRNVMRYGTIVKCFLAEDSKRITSSTFKVYIPSLMTSIENTGEDVEEDVNLDERCLNSDKSFENHKVKLSSTIVAKSIHNYGHRLDGWIPNFKVKEKKSSKIESNSTSGVTEEADLHTHQIKKSLTLNSIQETELDFNEATEVDFQELNRYYIKRGHPMYGCFIEGDQFEFVIMFIEGATPYVDQTEDDGGKEDIPFNFQG